MHIVTITSDMSQQDYYLGALKGVILSQCVGIQLVDIATQVNPFDLKQGAYILRNALPYYPQGTIHLININAAEAQGRMVVASHLGQYVVGFDNGVIPLICGTVPSETYVINSDVSESSSLLYGEGLANVINAITAGIGLAAVGSRTQQIRELRLMQYLVTSTMIKGTVQYIDRYGNAVTNITRQAIEQLVGDSPLEILWNNGSANHIHAHYGEVGLGELLCFYNAENKLEIAQNKHPIANVMGMKVDTTTVLVTKL